MMIYYSWNKFICIKSFCYVKFSFYFARACCIENSGSFGTNQFKYYQSHVALAMNFFYVSSILISISKYKFICNFISWQLELLCC